MTAIQAYINTKYSSSNEYVNEHITQLRNSLDSGKEAALTNYILAKTNDKRRIIDANNTEKYINSIAKEIAKRAVKETDNAIKEVLF